MAGGKKLPLNEKRLAADQIGAALDKIAAIPEVHLTGENLAYMLLTLHHMQFAIDSQRMSSIKSKGEGQPDLGSALQVLGGANRSRQYVETLTLYLAGEDVEWPE